MPGLLNHITCYALDMDGTIYLDDTWIDGAREFLAALDAAGKQYVFLTNNSSKSTAAYVEKLTRMGLDITAEKIITSGQATIRFLKRDFPGQKVYLLGNELLAAEFAAAGIALCDSAPGVVVVAFDTTLDYAKMVKVCDFVHAGLPYITTHPDLNCPVKGGYIPDVGAIHGFIYASTGQLPEKIIGKPYGEIVDYMLERTNAARNETAVVGDRIYTDVAAGVNHGLTGILVLSGAATMADVQRSKLKPHFIFESLKEMIQEI